MFLLFTKNNSTSRLLIVTMSLPVVVIVKKIKEAKRSNMKIGVGSVVTSEVGKA